MDHIRYGIFLIFIGLLSAGGPAYAQKATDYLRIGNDAIKQGAIDQAIVDYTNAIDADPSLAKAYDNRGVAYAKEGSFTRAIDDFTMAIADNPKDADAYNNRGLVHAEQGNLSQSIFDYTKSIELDTFYVKAYNNREIAFYKLKEYDKAWADVHTIEAIGGSVDPYALEDLKKASNRDQ